MSAREVQAVRTRLRASIGATDRVVLAISGGVDSMVLLDAVRHAVSPARLVIAHFDHGTGPAAIAARAAVVARAAALGIRCVVGRAESALGNEAALRDARWRFVRSVCDEHDAAPSTAHTEDDQIETVLMRVLRGAGA